ncbi:MAG TPA: WD40 repeat domain-containing protein, partial [Gemmata sp.]|nr:WD40 repeat domain-containing protein [Gemmata sp.]
FDKDYALAEKDSKGKKALAQKLFDGAPKRKTAAMVFACYEEARRLASAGGDVKLSLAAVSTLNKRFPSLPRSLLQDTLKQLAATEVSVADAPPLAQLAREESDLALDREDYDGALDLIGVAVVAAKKAEDPDLAIEMREYRSRLETLQKAIILLKTKPNDPTANTTLGTYWTFDRKRWETGLKYLAKGSDKTLAEAATMDLAIPKTANERTALADLWYKLYRDAKGDRKIMFVERAWEWYSAAIAVATGDDDLKPTERAKEIEKAFPNLFDQVFNGHTEAVAGIAITPDGKTLVSVGNDNAVRVWDVAAGKLLKTLEGHTSWVGSVVITPDGAKAITAGGDRSIRVWDLKTGRQSDILEGHVLAIRGLAISADGRYLVSGSSDKTCRLWDLSTNKEIKKFGDGKESIESVAITPDGNRILAGNESGMITVYDAKSGSVVSKFDKHGVSIVYAITVTKDGKTAISGARDKEIQVWEVATGKPLKTLSGHTEQVYQVILSLDEKQVLSVSYDKTIRIWDLATGKEVKRFEGHTDGVQGVCYSPNGRTIFSASWDKTIRKWRVPPVLTGPTTSPATKKID